MQKYQIKQIPKDFIVKEVPSFVFNKESGKYLIYKLKKTNRNTEDCIQFICKVLKTKRKFVGVAGTKDKNAVTEQYISIFNVQNTKNRVEGLKDRFENFSLEFIGFHNSPLSLGDLKGNRFEIVIRNLEKEFEIEKPYFIVNYFDDQRFSINNKEVGRAIIKKDFKNAVKLLKEQNNLDEETINLYKTDYIKIIRHIPIKILKMFIHSYQSYLFNGLCKKIILEKKYTYLESTYSQGKLFFLTKEPNTKLNVSLPLIGFGFEMEGGFVNLVDEIIKEENLDLRDFIIRQIPELSSFGAQRDFLIPISNFSKEDFLDDELNIGKKKVKIAFEIGKGSYATIVLKKIFEQ
jgi:tRNA pseudouridine13 synthase